jgi:membrane protein DedA with SNARE-associated domain
MIDSSAPYATLFALTFLAWAGLPVAGQPALIAAGVLAGTGNLSIEAVLIVGALGSALGGCVGYWLGVKGGRTLFTVRGPLHERRARELERGDRLVRRYGPVAVLILPTWVAGIFRMGWPRFLPWDVLAAILWTLAAGLGGYFVGPPIADVLKKANVLVLIAVGVVAAIAAGVYYLRRRRAESRSPEAAEDRPTTVP